MAREVPRGLVHHIRELAGLWRAEHRSDDELLAAFAAGDGAAFAALVVRHGQPVWATCRRVLGNDADAEDAFQATFIALARKAATVRPGAVAGWLRKVSSEVSLNARKAAHRRAEAHRRLLDRAAPRADDPPDEELRTAVADELARLPEQLRITLTLYYLEGKTQAEVGRILGITDRATAHRLKRGIRLLRDRLARRGVSVAAGILVAVLGNVPATPAAVPTSLVASAAEAALAVAAGVPTDTVAARLALDVAGVAGWARLKVYSLVLTTALGVMIGGVLFAQRAGEPARPEPPAPRIAVSPSSAEDPRTDQFGDPLPAGAIVRLGTLRFRTGYSVGSSSVAFGPGGKVLVSSHGGDSLSFWDPKTGREVRQLDGPIGCFAVSATPDGKRLAAIGDRDVWAWDLSDDTPKLLRKTPNKCAGPATVEFSPDGRLIACGGDVGEEIRLLDADKGSVTRILPTRGCRFAFSSNSKLLASWMWSPPGEVCIWEVATGTKRHTLASGEKDPTSSVAFSSDGKLLATVGQNRLLRIWDVAKGTESRRLANDADPHSFVDFLPDGTLLEIGGGRGRYWDAATGRAAKKSNPTMGGGWSAAYRLSPDGTYVAGAWLFGLGVWDVATGRELGPAAGMPDSFLHPVVFSRDGATIATSAFSEAKGARIQLWDAVTSRLRREFTVAHRETVWGLDLAADGTLFASLGSFRELPPDPPGRIARWGSDQQAQPELRLPKDTRSVAFAPNGLLAVALADSVVLRDCVTGREVQKLPSKCAADCLAFSADGHSLAASETDTRRVIVWSLPDGRERRRWTAPAGAEQQVAFRLPVALSPDGRLLAVGFTEPKPGIRIVDVATGTELAWLDVPPSGWLFQDIAFSPDGRTLATAGENGGVRVWEVASWRERYRFAGHRSGVLAIAFSPDGRRLASGSMDSTVLVWDVFTPQKPPPAERASPRQLWAALTGTDAAAAHRAIVSLAADPKTAVPLLKERLQGSTASVEQIRSWLNDLGSEQFAVREAAMEELARRGDEVEAELRQALASATSPEAKARLERLIARIGPHSAASRAVMRGIEALEQMGHDPAARRLLDELAKLPVESVAGREARAACHRLSDAQPRRK